MVTIPVVNLEGRLYVRLQKIVRQHVDLETGSRIGLQLEVSSTAILCKLTARVTQIGRRRLGE
jgi:hypothetical protein